MIFLKKHDIVELHRRLIDEFGGSAGFLQEGGLESALIAAENRHWYEDADVVVCAATYGFHLTQARAFVDGNKRVGAAAMEVFLTVNEKQLLAGDEAIYKVILGIADGSRSRADVESRLRDYVEDA